MVRLIKFLSVSYSGGTILNLNEHHLGVIEKLIIEQEQNQLELKLIN